VPLLYFSSLPASEDAAHLQFPETPWLVVARPLLHDHSEWPSGVVFYQKHLGDWGRHPLFQAVSVRLVHVHYMLPTRVV